MDSSRNRSEDVVYVRLIGEGTLVYRPVRADRVDAETFRLIAPPGHGAEWKYEPEWEEWEFEPGGVVRCERRVLGGNEVLVAVSPLERT
jgi:hypothetical protein